MSIDTYERKIDYLRISVTDRCNLRCTYCMPKEGIETFPQDQVLTFEEIVRLVNIFASIGVKRIRLTGGEPLVRKNIVNLVKSLAGLVGIQEVSLTTNGILLPFFVQRLKDAGLNRLNISLDTLNKEKFKMITGTNSFECVLSGIQLAKQAGFRPLKLNMVVMKGINDDEIIEFVEFAKSAGIILRFIEFMNITPLWNQDYFMPIEKIKEICEKRFKLERINTAPGFGPAQYYKVQKDSLLGFIKTDETNCRICTRLRLTSTGSLRICLYEDKGLSLKEFLRTGLSDKEILDIIKKKIGIKKEVDYRTWESSKFYMSGVGG